MFHFRFQSERVRRHVLSAALLANLSLFAGAIVLVAVPLVRASEINELASRERIEEPTITRRVEHERHLHLENRVAAFLQPARPCLGHAQCQILHPLPGHRLANGLLAPITC